MLILRLNFWRRADGTRFLSRFSGLISHSKKIKTTWVHSAMSPLSQHRYLGDNHSFFLKWQEFGRRFPIHFYRDIFISVSATSPACLSEECVCIAWARVCDIISGVVSSWKNWRKNSLHLDLDPTSFTLHKQCIHRNVGNLVGLLHGCSCSSVCAPILSSFTL